MREGEKARAQEIEELGEEKRWRFTTRLLIFSIVLCEVLGEQVKQTGSWVGEEGLRFDFTHFAPLSSEEIKAVKFSGLTKRFSRIYRCKNPPFHSGGSSEKRSDSSF